MTEEEAKKKWCPFARLGEVGATYNRCGFHAGLNCIASDCMAWVFEYSKPTGTTHGGKIIGGYCGLAGKP